jgi:hypothetical protein
MVDLVAHTPECAKNAFDILATLIGQPDAPPADPAMTGEGCGTAGGEAPGGWREIEAVQVTAADYGPGGWDGAAFRAEGGQPSLPGWLLDALDAGIVTPEMGGYDYAIWRVGKPAKKCDDERIDATRARPGDWIVRLPDGHIIRLDDRAYQQLVSAALARPAAPVTEAMVEAAQDAVLNHPGFYTDAHGNGVIDKDASLQDIVRSALLAARGPA